MGIPGEVRSPPRVHLDSDILRYVLDPSEDADLKTSSRELFFPRGRKPAVYCSAPAAGEFVSILAEDTIRQGRQADYEVALLRYWEYIRDGDLNVYMFGATPTTALRHARDLHAQDPLISPTDAAIVGCFLSDDSASVLYTTDTDIILSQVAIDTARGLGKRIDSP